MPNNLYSALFDFKDRIADTPWRAPANKLICKLATSGDTKTDFSHDLLAERMSFVESGAQAFLSRQSYEPMQLQALNHGYESLVFDCQNNFVLKIKPGMPYKNYKAKGILHAPHTDYSQKLNVSYGLWPKVAAAKPCDNDIKRTKYLLLRQGFYLRDHSPYNFGMIKDSKGHEDMVIIDDGAVLSFFGAEAWWIIAGDKIKPPLGKLYQTMPILHRPWKIFKDASKEILGLNHRLPDSPGKFEIDKIPSRALTTIPAIMPEAA